MPKLSLALSGNFFKLGLLKFDAHGKIEPGPGKGDHLLRLGFIGVWIRTSIHQYLYIDLVFANLLHEVGLGGDAHEDGNPFRCRRSGKQSTKN